MGNQQLSMSSKWNELIAHKTYALVPQIISIADTLWYSSAAGLGESGMVEYCVKTNKIKQITQYPDNLSSVTFKLFIHAPMNHRICEYHDIIYIIDGLDGRIISFDVSTKQFKNKLQIPKIGSFPCCVVITDKIHILNGEKNQKHLIYSITKNQIETFDDTITSSNITSVSIIHYNK
eukprot:298960_1